MTEMKLIENDANKFIKYTFNDGNYTTVHHISVNSITALEMVILDRDSSIYSIVIETLKETYNFSPLVIDGGSAHISLQTTYDWLEKAIVLNDKVEAHTAPLKIGMAHNGAKLPNGLEIENQQPTVTK